MIYGIGIDLIEIERIKNILERSDKLASKILSEGELKICPTNLNRRIEFIAGRFAGKEAIAKALGTGIGKKLSWRDIEILKLESGKPYVSLKKDNWTAEKFRIHISISHTKTLAIAKVVIEY